MTSNENKKLELWFMQKQIYDLESTDSYLNEDQRIAYTWDSQKPRKKKHAPN